jgi:hypothetical protein
LFGGVVEEFWESVVHLVGCDEIVWGSVI